MTRLAGQGVTVTVKGQTLVDGVDIALEPGTLTGLIGPNGAGKTTLVRALLGLIALDAGSVTLDGRPLGDLPREQRARTLAYLAQDRALHWPLTVEALVTLGRLPHRDPWRGPAPEDARAIANAMDKADIARFSDRVATTLSGGERARALLAAALAVEAPILLADEPVAGLDPAHQFAVLDVLKAQATAGGAALVVLHDLALAAHACSTLVLLDRGRCVAAGPPEDVLTSARLAEVYGLKRAGDVPFPPRLPFEPLL